MGDYLSFLWDGHVEILSCSLLLSLSSPSSKRLEADSSRACSLVCSGVKVGGMCQIKVKAFYARFDVLHRDSAVESTLPPEDLPPSVSTADGRKLLLRVTSLSR